MRALASALGGRKGLRASVRSELDLATATMEGLSAEAANAAVARGLLTAEELHALVIPRRTFDRRVAAGMPLTPEESDRLVRLATVALRAEDALGSAEKAERWLRTPNRSLNGLVPLALLVTDTGARMVERALGRIEHGVFS